jgi:hypothetical protein
MKKHHVRFVARSANIVEAVAARIFDGCDISLLSAFLPKFTGAKEFAESAQAEYSVEHGHQRFTKDDGMSWVRLCISRNSITSWNISVVGDDSAGGNIAVGGALCVLEQLMGADTTITFCEEEDVTVSEALQRLQAPAFA